MSRLVLRGSLLVLTAVSLPAFGMTNPLDEGLRKCARETDQSQRLACYDALAGTLPKVEADRVGMTADIAQKREQKREPVEKRAAPPETLTAKIRSVRENSHGQLIFSLDNDQVWIQDQPSSNIRFSAGDEIRIEHGALTSLWLVADHGRKTRVRRLS